MSKPIVGITAWRRVLDTFLGPEQLQTLSSFYSNAVIEAGMIPIIYPNGQRVEEVMPLIDLVDGLLISGGDDVDPAMYEAELTDSTSGQDITVDRFEVELVNEARAQGKPVLAICRGIQLLNVALGGTLNQNVTSPGGVHEVIDADTDPDELVARHHAVLLEKDSFLAGVFDSTELKVNTLHHQGVDRLADELIVEGRAPDGLIEAARCDGSWWALAVQWHPERMESSDHGPLMNAFKDAIEAG